MLKKLETCFEKSNQHQTPRFLLRSVPALLGIGSLHVRGSVCVQLAGHSVVSAAGGVLLGGAGPGVLAAAHQHRVHGSRRSPVKTPTCSQVQTLRDRTSAPVLLDGQRNSEARGQFKQDTEL